MSLKVLAFELDDVSPHASEWRQLLSDAREPILPLLRAKLARRTPGVDEAATARWETRAVNVLRDGGYVSLRVPATATVANSAGIEVRLSGRSRFPRLRIRHYPRPGLWAGKPPRTLDERTLVHPGVDEVIDVVVGSIGQLIEGGDLDKDIRRR
jgi:hypothetical protein